MSDTVIQVDNISKLYRLGEVGTGTLRHDFNRWWHKMRGKEDPYARIGETNDRETKGDSDYAWALKDVSFEVKRGEVLGIIGRNGAGKSTLLKILSRVTTPTTGEVRVKGRIASLLEVGTGFNPELTGRDNIFLNGAILGMTKAEIKNKFDEIVDFSGVERYIDTPVKRFSSGMYVRLAFAVAAHLEPEILIVDEVLAVGDAEFQKKCLGKMGDVARQGRTVLFVSHNMAAIITLCTRSILLDRGGIECDCASVDAVGRYLSFNTALSAETWQCPNRPDATPVYFASASVVEIGLGKLVIECALRSVADHREALLAFDITDSTGTPIMQVMPSQEPFVNSSIGQHQFSVDVELPLLIPGKYFIDMWVGSHFTETYNYVHGVLCFHVLESPILGRTYPHSTDHGMIVANATVKSVS